MITVYLLAPQLQCVLTIYSGGFNSDRKLDEGLSFIF